MYSIFIIDIRPKMVSNDICIGTRNKIDNHYMIETMKEELSI